MIRNLMLFVILSGAPLFAGDESLLSPLRAAAGSRTLDSLSAVLFEARRLELPIEPLENKIREGITKKRPAAEILRVVELRSRCLAQIIDGNRGTMPAGYQKRLFALERERFTLVPGSPNAEPAAAAVAQNAPVPGPAAVARVEKPKTVREKENVNDTLLTQQRLEQKSEAAQDKALKKAEKQQEQAEKRLEKIERKNERKQK